MNQKDYIEYISRLIDRDLQQKQANGFTLWAIVGVLFYLSLDIVDKVPVLLEWPHIKFYPFLIIVITINYLVFFVLFLYSSININKIRGKRKLITKFNSQNEAKYYSYILLIIVGILNLKAGYLIHSLMFKLFGIFFIYIAVRPHPNSSSVYTELKSFYSNLKSFYVKLKLLYKNPKLFYVELKLFFGISEPTPLKKPGLKLNSNPQIIQRAEYISLAFFSIMVTISLTSYVFTTSFRLDNSADVITLAIELFAFFILLIILVNQFLVLRASKWLEDLEQDIYINGLDEEEIRTRLLKEYIGQPIENWLSEEIREYEFIDESIEIAHQQINLHLSSMRQIRKEISTKDSVSIDDTNKYKAEIDRRNNEVEIVLQNLKDLGARFRGISDIIADKMKAILNEQYLDSHERSEILKINQYYREILLKRSEKINQMYVDSKKCLNEDREFETESNIE